MAIRDMSKWLQDIIERVTLLERRLISVGRYDTTPVGTMTMFAGSVAPNGYLLAQGGTVAIASYPGLFDVIGTTYGGNGTTTFGLPDMRGRAPVGMSAGDADFGSLNGAVGAKTHTLTTAQMPSHTHSSAGSGRFMTTDRSTIAKRVGTTHSSGAWVPAVDEANVITTVTATEAAGSGGAHNNIQPSRVVNFIIKT